ncbi:hypothetical protein GGF46_004753 [Coemansia sp. RSA 552]|nr:hypothetical protein GGF46_004753 [Coemansia sp. RSA 552]
MLKQITSVRASFCPFSPHATSAKVFLTRVLSKKNHAANPQCKIDIRTTQLVKDPSLIDVTFKDGKKFHLDGAEMQGDDLVMVVEKYSKRLSQQEDLKSQ